MTGPTCSRVNGDLDAALLGASNPALDELERIMTDQPRGWAEWASMMVRELKLDVPVPVVRTAPVPRRAATWRPGELTVDSGREWPVSAILGEVLHGLLHEAAGAPGHGVEFRRRAASIGLWIDRNGRTSILDGPSPFRAFLRRHGVQVEAAPEKRPGRSTLKLWTCGCTKIRAGREIAVQCQRCGRVFQAA